MDFNWIKCHLETLSPSKTTVDRPNASHFVIFTSFYNNVGVVHAAKTFHPLLAMKFCKNLQRVVDISDPEWSPYWVNYKMLKVSARGKRRGDSRTFLALAQSERTNLGVFLRAGP